MEQKDEEKEKSDDKKTLQRNLLVHESIEIRRKKTSIGLGLNDPQFNTLKRMGPHSLQIKGQLIYDFGCVLSIRVAWSHSFHSIPSKAFVTVTSKSVSKN